jgi:hypothetical protein
VREPLRIMYCFYRGQILPMEAQGPTAFKKIQAFHMKVVMAQIWTTHIFALQKRHNRGCEKSERSA